MGRASRQPSAQRLRRAERIYRHLRKMYPHQRFQISVTGLVQRKRESGWVTVCWHNKELPCCVHPACGGGRARCPHGSVKSHCRECSPELFCFHGRPWGKCDQSGCTLEGLLRIRGLGQVKRKTCAACGASHHRQGYECCTRCDPGPTLRVASRVACRYLCALSHATGVHIRHVHYEPGSNEGIGKEYRLPEWHAKPVDGYFERGRVVIEFLGDQFHGHPRLWASNPEARDMFKRPHKENFETTQVMLAKMAAFGYRVFYVWESEYRRLAADEDPRLVLRRFRGVLEH